MFVLSDGEFGALEMLILWWFLGFLMVFWFFGGFWWFFGGFWWFLVVFWGWV